LRLPHPARIWSRDLIEEEMEGLMTGFEGIAKARYRRGMAIISLICNVRRTSAILERAFRVLNREDIRVQMMSQGASKTNIALIVEDGEAKAALRALHAEFFEGEQPQ
jgi:aspartate kinase